jgi:large subunit ribosomal protein L15
MAEKKSTTKKPAARAKTSSKATATKAVKPKTEVTSGSIAMPQNGVLKLGALKPSPGSRPKRQRIGRGHGSGMVKTGGEGGKGQTVRSGGGKGPAFEGGQTPWARRLPHARGYSQKGRDTGHFGTRLAVVNLHQLASWDAGVEVTPESLKEKGVLKNAFDGVKILGGAKPGKELPTGLKFRDVLFSTSARQALEAAGAKIEGSGE